MSTTPSPLDKPSNISSNHRMMHLSIDSKETQKFPTLSANRTDTSPTPNTTRQGAQKRVSSMDGTESNNSMMSPDPIRSSLVSPVKRRRRFQRRNSVLVQREAAMQLSESVLDSMGERDNDQSIPNLFPTSSRHSTQSSSSIDQLDNDSVHSVLRPSNVSCPDLYASWGNSKDTECSMELSMMSISSATALNECVNNDCDPTESATSFTASSSDLAAHEAPLGSRKQSTKGGPFRGGG